MTTISINLSTTDLLKGVKQLEPNDLEAFVKSVLQIRAKRLADSLSEEETTLLEQINVGLSEEEQELLQAFAQKSEAGILTLSENEAYLELSEKLEYLNGKRLIALGKLAQLRGVSVEGVTKAKDNLSRNLGAKF
jgi:DNA-binding MarR family transcriptional regulator